MHSEISRRYFLESGAVALGAAALPFVPAKAASAKYTRYNATSQQGREMLKSYAVAIEKMLALPPTDARNWFRNAFIHTMDCPHGNWWFFVWHRGFVGWFERTVRELSGNPNFAFPYWDWTQSPRIPDQMFDGVLTPTDAAYNKYISSYEAFYAYINPALTAFWKERTPAQISQLNIRGYTSLDVLWGQVKNNPMYAPTQHARWLTRANPALDPKVAKMCDPATISSGLSPTTFIPFNSNKTPSHNTQPSSGTVFGVLEGLPHNNVHNNIGGYTDDVPKSDYGYMQDNLSPTDPIFFLHHANMDRLWEIWIRKQAALGLPTLPSGADLVEWEREPFLFYIDAQGKPVTKNRAGDYATIDGFDYDYQPGFGVEEIPSRKVAAKAGAHYAGSLRGGVGSVAVPAAVLTDAAKGGRKLVAQITVPHPDAADAPRNFDVLINAPADVTTVTADSPYYGGTLAFFGFMPGMAMDATFAVPLNTVLGALNNRQLLGAQALQIRVVPQGKKANLRAASPLKAVAVQLW